MEHPDARHSDLLHALQAQARTLQMAAVRGLPAGVYASLVEVHDTIHGRKPENEEEAGALLHIFLKEAEENMEVGASPSYLP